ncbi:MAG: AAA family ATPase [Halanaerobiales bacterium]|nr:AAA family ATPase [Halanaerobiales bacterium]
MRHLEELTIDRFRGIKDLELRKFEMINIFVGKNNSGKTSILEAIELFKFPLDLSHYVKVSRIRDSLSGSSRILFKKFELINSIMWLFPKEHKKLSIEDAEGGKKNIGLSSIIHNEKIELVIQGKEKKYVNIKQYDENLEELMDNLLDDEVRILELDIKLLKNGNVKKIRFEIEENSPIEIRTSQPIIHTRFLTPVEYRLEQYFSQALIQAIDSDYRPKVIDALQLFDKNIEGIEFLPSDTKRLGSKFIPYIKHKVLGTSPLSTFGDGVRKAVTLASEVVNCRGGVLLIDELETAIHTEVLGNIFSWLVDVCKLFKVQLFATTHSLEAIDAVLEASEDCLDNLATYRLEVKEEATIAKRFSGKTLYDLRYELGQDVR